jgi:CrcB protein
VLFAGSGVLGGFTTMSTFAVQTDRLLADGHPVRAAAYLVTTVAAAALAAHVVRRAVLRRAGEA